MPSLNRIILMGNLTRDPEVKFTNDGNPVCQFGMAVNTRRSEGKEDVLFIEVVTFGNQAEACGKYLAKSRPVLVEGSLRLEKWTTREGDSRQTYKVLGSTVQFLGDGTPSRGERNAVAPAREQPELDFDDLPF